MPAMLLRITVAIFVSMAGVGVKGDFCPGNGVPRDLWHCTFSLSFYLCGAIVVISSTIAMVVCGS